MFTEDQWRLIRDSVKSHHCKECQATTCEECNVGVVVDKADNHLMNLAPMTRKDELDEIMKRR